MRKIIILLTVICFLTCSCSTVQPVEAPPEMPISEVVDVGDELIITTTDDEEFILLVKEITKTELIGEKRTVPLSSIKTIKRDDIDVWRTAGLAGGIAIGTYLLVGIIGVFALMDSLENIGKD